MWGIKGKRVHFLPLLIGFILDLFPETIHNDVSNIPRFINYKLQKFYT